VLLIVNAVITWKTDARLERQLAAIREAGDPLTLADLAREPIPPDKNAATYFRQAEAEATAFQDEMRLWIEAELDTHIEDVRYFHEDFLCFTRNRPMPERMRKAMKAVHAAHPKLVPLLRTGVECPDYDAQLDYSTGAEQLTTQLLPIIQNARSIARVFAYHARLAAIDGDGDEVARMALATSKLARHIERNPFLVSYLVALTIQGMAIEEANFALQAGSVSQELRQALDTELAIQERMDGYLWAVRSDRPCMIDMFSRFPLRNFWLYNRGRWNREESECLDVIASYLAMAPEGHPYRPSKLTVDKTTGQVSGSLTELYYPSLDATHAALMKIRTLIRCLRVLNALQTHAKAGSNEIPKLAGLGLPAETITDPYITDPTTYAHPALRVKKIPQGWIVYSVGPNGQDDGGKVEDTVNGDIGVGPPPAAAKPGEPGQK
jgi:hypothetical protein